MAAVDSAIGTYGEGVKWILAIAAGAIGGTFLHLDLVKSQVVVVQIAVVLSLMAFSVSVGAGMNYLLWLNRELVAQERIREQRSNLQGANPPSQTAADDAQKIIQKEQGIVDSAASAKRPWHVTYTNAFIAGFVFAIAAVSVSIGEGIAHPKPANASDDKKTCPACTAPVPDKPAYTLASSGMHRTGHGMEQHTFLLNTDTGEVWQMRCGKDGLVSFVKIPVESK